MDDGAPGVLASVKTAAVASCGTVAVTSYVPAVLLAVKAAEVAIPCAFVVAVAIPPAKVPPPPEFGAAKVTTTSGIGFPARSFTSATKGAANAVLIVAFCGVPPAAMIAAGTGAVLVSVNVAGTAAPGTVAVT